MRVAMVTRWGVACGLDNYARELVSSVADAMDVAVFAAVEPGAVDYGLGGVRRDWESDSDDASRLVRDLEAFAPDVVHVQYHVGYLAAGLLESTLRWADARGVPSIVQLHAVASANEAPDALSPTLVGLLSVLHRASAIVVHSEKDRARLAGSGLTGNVRIWRLGERAWPRFDAARVRDALGIGDRSPVVATFGFLQPRKGALDLIAAVDMLRRRHPSVLLLSCNAIHPRSDGDDLRYYLACRDAIDRLGVGGNVALLTEYLPQGVAMTLLQASDVIVLPYRHSPEGTSAAAKFCCAAGRPMLVSTEQIFDSYRDVSRVMSSLEPRAVAEAIETLLASPADAAVLAGAAAARADAGTWESVSREYVMMLGEVTGKTVG